MFSSRLLAVELVSLCCVYEILRILLEQGLGIRFLLFLHSEYDHHGCFFSLVNDLVNFK